MLAGQWQVAWYVFWFGAGWLISGSEIVALLAVALAWGFEPSFINWVNENGWMRVDVQPRNIGKPMTAPAPSKKPARPKTPPSDKPKKSSSSTRRKTPVKDSE